MRPLLKGTNVKFLRITTKPDALQTAIDETLAQLKGLEATSNEYIEIMEQVTALYKLQEKNSPKRVSPDTVLVVVGNLAGIALILGYEQAHVVTSKALAFVIKSKTP
jgi:ABC-type hemin transport system substrate-binding protein